MSTYVAVLYSIVLGPGRRLVMADLKDMAEGLGLRRARTLVATGNLVFEADGTSPGELEARLEEAFAARFGKLVPILVRTRDEWVALVAGNPFPEESASDGSQVMVRVQRVAPDAAVIEGMAGYCTQGERIVVVGRDIWVHFAGPANLSKLLPALTAKRLGIGTARNWNTARRLGEMLGAN